MLGKSATISMICLTSFQESGQKSKVLSQASSTPLTGNDERGVCLFWTNDHQEWYRRVYLNSDHWKSLKAKKLSANPACERCASRCRLDVHHVNYHNLFDVQITDLLTLCRPCHDAEHEANGMPRRSRTPLFRSRVIPEKVQAEIRNQTLPKYLNFISFLADRTAKGKPIGDNLLKRLSDLQRILGIEVEPG